jgi:gliding motility-associated-like protein
MKKILSLFLCLFASVSLAFADFQENGQFVKIQNLTDIDFVYVFNGLSGAEISYTSNVESDFKWQKYTQTSGIVEDVAGGTSTGTSTTLPVIESDTYYILEINGTEAYNFYVFDYQNYLPTINYLKIDEENSNCEHMSFLLNMTFGEMTYYTPAPSQGTIGRNAYLTYNTLSKDNGTKELKEEEKETTINAIVSSVDKAFSISDLYAYSTRLLLFGDQFAKAFAYDKLTTTTAVLRDTIQAVSPIIHIWGAIDALALNVLNRQEGKLDGRELESSAPVNVNLSTEANLKNGFYRWTIENENGNIVGQSTEPAFQYSFEDAGNYKVKVTLTANNDLRCVAEDEITVSVWDSEIEVPNVFTPNDDGMNDKFCVAYKSLLSYEMWVYNRWGRLVFHSTSTDFCWDGYINNAKAPSGTYFYYIEAIGADTGREYKLKGDINLLR